MRAYVPICTVYGLQSIQGLADAHTIILLEELLALDCQALGLCTVLQQWTSESKGNDQALDAQVRSIMLAAKARLRQQQAAGIPSSAPVPAPASHRPKQPKPLQSSTALHSTPRDHQASAYSRASDASRVTARHELLTGQNRPAALVLPWASIKTRISRVAAVGAWTMI